MAQLPQSIPEGIERHATIPSNYSRLIARELGLPKRRLPALLHQTGLSVERFLQEETLLTAQQQICITQNALTLSEDAAFGLRLGRLLTPATHGAMGFLANSSPDLHTALQAIRTFLPTRISFAKLELAILDDQLECAVSFEMGLNDAVLRCISETFAITFFETAEFIVGRTMHEAITRFTFTPPAYVERYPHTIPGTVEFSAAKLSVTLPFSVCQEPNVSANTESYLLALQQCETLLKQLRSDKLSYQYRVEKMMLSQPPGTLREEDAAAALFISKRTLARKLHSEGTRFREIQEAILSQQASAYLQESQLSVDAIAAMLNYHDSANFRRAFKRWFGVTPSDYRRETKRPA